MRLNHKSAQSLLAMFSVIFFGISCNKGRSLQTEKEKERPKTISEMPDTLAKGEVSKESFNREKMDEEVRKAHVIIAEQFTLRLQTEAELLNKNASESTSESTSAFLCLMGTSSSNETLNVSDMDHDNGNGADQLNQSLDKMKQQNEDLKGATSMTIQPDSGFITKTEITVVCNRKGEILQAVFEVKAEIRGIVLSVEVRNEKDPSFHKEATILMEELRDDKTVVKYHPEMSLGDSASTGEEEALLQISQIVQNSKDTLSHDPLVMSVNSR